MKNIKLLCTMLCTLLCTISFVACGDDDDKKDDSSLSFGTGGSTDGSSTGGSTDGRDEVTILGEWKYTFSSGYVIYCFYADGTGYTREYDAEDGGWFDYEYFTYTYSESSKQLTIHGSEDGMSYVDRYKVTSMTASRLVLSDEQYGRTKTLERQSYLPSGSGGSGTGSSTASWLVGTWRSSFSTGYIISVFNADGTGYSREYDSEDGGWSGYDYFSYMYDESTGLLGLMFSDGEIDIYTVKSHTSSTLIVVDEDGDTTVFYKQ